MTPLPLSWRLIWLTLADNWLTVECHLLIKLIWDLGLYKLAHVFNLSLPSCSWHPPCSAFLLVLHLHSTSTTHPSTACIADLLIYTLHWSFVLTLCLINYVCCKYISCVDSIHVTFREPVCDSVWLLLNAGLSEMSVGQLFWHIELPRSPMLHQGAQPL